MNDLKGQVSGISCVFCIQSVYHGYSNLPYCILVVKTMPMPEDKQVVETAENLVKGLKGAFGTPPGYRPGKIHRRRIHLARTITSNFCLQLMPKGFY